MDQTLNSSSSAICRATFKERSPGVELGLLRRHEGGGLTFLMRMQKGARAERHGHPGGEETYLLSGRLRIDRRAAADGQSRPSVVLEPGDYLFVPPGELHEGEAEEDCTFLVVAPGGLAAGSERDRGSAPREAT